MIIYNKDNMYKMIHFFISQSFVNSKLILRIYMGNNIPINCFIL